MEEVSNAKHYIAVNAGGRYPLLKTAQDYTEYFHEALSFSDLYETYRSRQDLCANLFAGSG